MGELTTPPDLQAAMDEFRRARLATIESMFRELPLEAARPVEDRYDETFRYALAHHVLDRLEVGVEAGDRSAISEALADWSDPGRLRPVDTLHGPVLVARPTDEVLQIDTTKAAMPITTIDPGVCRAADDKARSDVARALQMGTDAGFGDLLASQSKVVVLLRERGITDEVSSWTTSRFPATVHTDFFDEPWLLARDLVHEGAHSALNDLIVALDIDLPDEPTFYSPWKGTDRPVFGFVHAIWAFSHVRIYCEWLMDNEAAPDDVRRLAAHLTDKYGGELASVRDDGDAALELIPHAALAGLIRSVRDRALSTALSARAAG